MNATPDTLEACDCDEWFRVARWVARRYHRGSDHPEHDDFRSIALLGIAEAWAAVRGTNRVRETFGAVAVSAARFAVLREINHRNTLKRGPRRECPTERIEHVAVDTKSGRWYGPQSVDDRDLVESLMRRLTNRQREIVVRQMRGETGEEIVKLIGVPLRTVMRENGRAMAKLREARSGLFQERKGCDL